MLLSTRGHSGWDCKPYQFSCIHRMASSSLNCRSNSYSCRASTDMALAVFRLRAAGKQDDNSGPWRRRRGGGAGVSILVGFAADPVSHRSRCRQELADADTDVCGQLAGRETFILRRLREPTPSSSQRGAQGPNAGAVCASIRAIYFTPINAIK